MNIVVEKQPKCLATLRVEIPADKVAGERAKIVAGYTSQAKLPGFRPGKAPQKVVEKRFQKEIGEELESHLFNKSFDEALRKEDLKVLDFGVPSNVTHTVDGGFSFESTIVLAPEFSLPEYKGITVKVPSAEISDEAVEKEVNELRQRFANFEAIEGRAAQSGDFAVIDFTTTLDGKSIEEVIGKSAGFLGGREGFWVKVDEASFLPGFAKQLEGLEVGGVREITLTLPEDFPLSDVRGKEVVFNVTLKELKQSILPEFDQEFANKLLPGKTPDEIRATIREHLAEQRKSQIEEIKVDQIVKHFDTAVEFEIPEALLERETQGQASQLIQRAAQSGLTQEDLVAQQSEILETAGTQAKTNLKTNFILQEIARAENISVSDQELLQRLAGVAQQRKTPLKKLIKEVQRNGQLQGLRNSMLVGKAIDFLVEQAKVEETTESDA